MLFAAAMAVFVSVAVQLIDSNDFWDQSICLYFWMIMALPFAAYWSMQQAAEIEEDVADRPTLPGVIITTNTQERSGLSDHEGSGMQKHEPERPEKGYIV